MHIASRNQTHDLLMLAHSRMYTAVTAMQCSQICRWAKQNCRYEPFTRASKCVTGCYDVRTGQLRGWYVTFIGLELLTLVKLPSNVNSDTKLKLDVQAKHWQPSHESLSGLFCSGVLTVAPCACCVNRYVCKLMYKRWVYLKSYEYFLLLYHFVSIFLSLQSMISSTRYILQWLCMAWRSPHSTWFSRMLTFMAHMHMYKGVFLEWHESHEASTQAQTRVPLSVKTQPARRIALLWEE